jgi:hypothetical protein
MRSSSTSGSDFYLVESELEEASTTAGARTLIWVVYLRKIAMIIFVILATLTTWI